MCLNCFSRRDTFKLAALLGAGALARPRRASAADAPVRIGYLPITDAAPLLLAHARGLFEARHEVAVEFDDRELAERAQQRQRQRAVAGADLDDVLARTRRDRAHDGGDDRVVVQEVLAELLLVDVARVAHACIVADARAAEGARR